jgi:ribosome-binding factor A
MGKFNRVRGSHDRADQRSHSIRHERLESLLREELNFILGSEMRDPVFENLRITRVELARDGSRARLWYGRNRTEAVDDAVPCRTEGAALARAAGFLRRRLNDALELKRLPDLCFCRDPAVYSDLQPDELESALLLQERTDPFPEH